MPANLAQYLLAAALGGFVGMGEIISRYRDSPGGALATLAAWIYILVNAAAAAATLWLAILLQIDFKATAESTPWIRVLAAGFGAMAILRSSSFTRQAGGAEARIGPGNLLQTILESADRAVDREQSKLRAQQSATLAAGISFEKTYAALPAYCFALMQNLSEKDQTAAAESIKKLRDSGFLEEVKTRMLVTYVANAVGYGAVEAAIKSLGDKLK